MIYVTGACKRPKVRYLNYDHDDYNNRCRLATAVTRGSKITSKITSAHIEADTELVMTAYL